MSQRLVQQSCMPGTPHHTESQLWRNTWACNRLRRWRRWAPDLGSRLGPSPQQSTTAPEPLLLLVKRVFSGHTEARNGHLGIPVLCNFQHPTWLLNGRTYPQVNDSCTPELPITKPSMTRLRNVKQPALTPSFQTCKGWNNTTAIPDQTSRIACK